MTFKFWNVFFWTNLMHGVRIRELNVVRNCLNRKYDSVISDKTRKLWILLKKVVIFNISLTEIRNHPKNVILEKITIILKKLKRTVSDPLYKEDNVRFTTVPLKRWSARRVQRYMCVHLARPAFSCKFKCLLFWVMVSLN